MNEIKKIHGSLRIEPVFESKANAVVVSFNDDYSKYFSVLLQSLIENSSKTDLYDIVVMTSGVSENNRRKLLDMLPENFRLRFFDITEYICENFPEMPLKTTDNWSVEMYYRIFIPPVMPKYSRVLYLDTDTVVKNSINELFEIDFEGKQIFAVKDTPAQILHLAEYKERREQIKNDLNLKEEKNYFNSGMIVFNIAEIKETEYKGLIKKFSTTKKLLFPDQDLLNMIFENRVKYLHCKWNLCSGSGSWGEKILQNIAGDYKEDYLCALKTPHVLHFISPQKPWNTKLRPYSESFWVYAEKTPFYEEILSEMNKTIALQSEIEERNFANLNMQIQTEKRIVLWGASLFLEKFVKNYDVKTENILGIADKNPDRHGTFVGKYKVFSPEELSNLNPDEIIITIVNSSEKRAAEIKEYLEKQNLKIPVKTI